jgi:hypothetical protein
MVGALYSSILVEHVSSSYSLFNRYPSFKEYNFVAGCLPSNAAGAIDSGSVLCPSDFGSLSDRSRVPYENGSIEHSSVYLYSSQIGAIRDDTLWNSTISANPSIKHVSVTYSKQRRYV